jgi:hypothetical protein
MTKRIAMALTLKGIEHDEPNRLARADFANSAGPLVLITVYLSASNATARAEIKRVLLEAAALCE